MDKFDTFILGCSAFGWILAYIIYKADFNIFLNGKNKRSTKNLSCL